MAVVTLAYDDVYIGSNVHERALEILGRGPARVRYGIYAVDITEGLPILVSDFRRSHSQLWNIPQDAVPFVTVSLSSGRSGKDRLEDFDLITGGMTVEFFRPVTTAGQPWTLGPRVIPGDKTIPKPKRWWRLWL